MRLLTKLELDKLIRRKYLLLGGLLLLGYSSFMFFSCCMNSSPTFPVETADGVEVMNGIAFGQSSHVRFIKTKRSFDICYSIEENTHKRGEVQLQIEDIKPN